MKTITLPVVAHRILSKQYSRKLVWEKPPSTYYQRLWWQEWVAHMNFPGQGRGRGEKDWNEPGEISLTLDFEHGTVRSIEEILDIFDGGHRTDSSSDNHVNRIWEAAGITFRLIGIVDEGVPPVRSVGIDHESVIDVARDLNTPKMVNVYFFQNIIGAAGVGGWSPDPLQKTHRLVPFAAEKDIASWDRTVVVLAHELGHLLNLDHHADPENLMFPNASSRSGITPKQIIISRNHAKYYSGGVPTLLPDKAFRVRYLDAEEPPMRRNALLDGPLVFGYPLPRPGCPTIEEDYVLDSGPVFGYRLPRPGDPTSDKDFVLGGSRFFGDEESVEKMPGEKLPKIQKQVLALLSSLEMDSFVIAQLATLPDITDTLTKIISKAVKATGSQRQNAVYALGRIGDPKASNVLLKVLDSKDQPMRLTALVALKALGPDTLIRKRLLRFARDKNVEPVEADHARLALGQKVNAFSNIDLRRDKTRYQKR